jgi:hypothetical protein
VKKNSTSAEPSNESAGSDALGTWDFDASKLAKVAEFVERMRKAGAVGVRVGPVSVAWDGPPQTDTPAKDKRKGLTERDILMHSA